MQRLLLLCLLAWSLTADATGLRSLVALPVDQGGSVLRMLVTDIDASDTRMLETTWAYGLSGRQTLFLGMPYRLSPSDGDRSGPVNLTYRHTLWQDDFRTGTRRAAGVLGLQVPTEQDRDVRVRIGGVATWYEGRHQWDADLVALIATAGAQDAARYDLAWDYRLSPSEYPDWGKPAEWHLIGELGGRYIETAGIVHQFTAGLRYTQRRWMLEGGLVRDLNKQQDRQALLGLRIHF